MADALCGPSNALQSFQKHTSVDRTLQQDRLRLRQSPSQSFRSSPGPSSYKLDAEFEAFQANAPLTNFHDHLHLGPPPPQASGFALQNVPQQQLPNWAMDFQQLDIHERSRSTSPMPSAQFRHAAPLQRSVPGESWQYEFARQEIQAPQQQQQQQNSSFVGFGAAPLSQMSHYQPYSTMNSPASYLSPIAQQKQPERLVEDTFDEAAFAQAFDAASTEMSQENTDVTRSKEVDDFKFDLNFACTDPGDITGEYDFSKIERLKEDQDINSSSMRGKSRERHVQFDDHRNEDITEQEYTPRIGADTIDPDQYTPGVPDPDVQADELARTAGQLLDNLKHEQSEKFQKSNFLALMRQLRDKEVRVEGDKMVENLFQSTSLHPGGQFYPGVSQNTEGFQIGTS